MKPDWNADEWRKKMEEAWRQKSESEGVTTPECTCNLGSLWVCKLHCMESSVLMGAK